MSHRVRQGLRSQIQITDHLCDLRPSQTSQSSIFSSELNEYNEYLLPGVLKKSRDRERKGLVGQATNSL